MMPLLSDMRQALLFYDTAVVTRAGLTARCCSQQRQTGRCSR